MRIILFACFAFLISLSAYSQNGRVRDYGIYPGVLPAGQYNSITDVRGVKVGHTTLISGDNIRTGVTAILPHSGNIYKLKVPAAIYIGNGYGKLTGISQVKELGNIETPLVLTNTMSVPLAFNALISYTINREGNEDVRSVNAVVGETNDGFLNDIRGRHVKEEHVLDAIRKAVDGEVEEGNVGAGTGTVCFGFKGGIGTSSRSLPGSLGGYTVGVLVQTNFGGVLQIDGVPVGEELGRFSFSRNVNRGADGSCMIVVATDAPLDARNLERLAKRAFMGLARTGGIASNGSGDYVIAFSVAEENLIDSGNSSHLTEGSFLSNDAVSPLFLAAIEATEEAILNSLFAARTMKGMDGHTVESLPLDEVIKIMRKYNKISIDE
ncbi:MAG: P1 family peptidase [Bacteroidales bacterium]|jgi:D-aminopeptidase|nr:P1 family peptidase [Bacteroidales bacterium]